MSLIGGISWAALPPSDDWSEARQENFQKIQKDSTTRWRCFILTMQLSLHVAPGVDQTLFHQRFGFFYIFRNIPLFHHFFWELSSSGIWDKLRVSSQLDRHRPQQKTKQDLTWWPNGRCVAATCRGEPAWKKKHSHPQRNIITDRHDSILYSRQSSFIKAQWQ